MATYPQATPGGDNHIGSVTIDGFEGGAIDVTSGASINIDFAHHEIHEGDSFMFTYSAGSKNDGQTINAYFKTPNTTKDIHMLFQWSASGQSYGRIREAPTVTSNTGTSAAIYNRNRDSATTATIVDNATTPAANKVSYDVTVTAAGTIIWQEFSGAAKQQGAASRNTNEILLKANTAYVFEVESDAAGLVLHLEMSWYEHTPSA